MIQQTYKLLSGAILLALVGTALPFAAFAEDATGGVKVGNIRAGKNFCTELPQIEARITSGLGEREEKLGNRQEERDLKLSNNRSERDGKRTGNRSQWDVTRESHYAKLDERASTTAQKAAVATFKTSIEAAVATRKTGVDTAVATYRAGIDQAIKDRRAAIAPIVNALKNSSNEALAKAKTDCAANVAPATVRQTFVASIKTARDTFKVSREGLDKVSAKLDALRDARKTAIEKALADFKTAAEKARAELKNALKAS